MKWSKGESILKMVFICSGFIAMLGATEAAADAPQWAYAGLGVSMALLGAAFAKLVVVYLRHRRRPATHETARG